MIYNENNKIKNDIEKNSEINNEFLDCEKHSALSAKKILL